MVKFALPIGRERYDGWVLEGDKHGLLGCGEEGDRVNDGNIVVGDDKFEEKYGVKERL